MIRQDGAAEVGLIFMNTFQGCLSKKQLNMDNSYQAVDAKRFVKI